MGAPVLIPVDEPAAVRHGREGDPHPGARSGSEQFAHSDAMPHRTGTVGEDVPEVPVRRRH